MREGKRPNLLIISNGGDDERRHFILDHLEAGSFMDAFNDEEVPNNSEPPKNRKRRLSVQEDNCIICLQRIQDR
jgi:hypothetical protein